ncbi:MAG: DegV family protein [Lachnospirales bacterium]
MNKYQLISDSSCDISLEKAKKLDIEIIPFSISFDSKEYLAEHYDISIDEFYNKINSKKIYPKTSLPSVQTYYDVFEKHIKNEKEIICICLSHFLSGSYQSANTAKNMILEKYPNSNIAIIDSLSATLAQFLLVEQCAKLIKENIFFDVLVDIIETNRKNNNIFLAINNLDYLVAGGRVGKAASLASNLLNISPILYLQEGELLPLKKARGKAKSLNCIVDEAVNKFNIHKGNVKVAAIYANHIEDAYHLRDEFAKRTGYPAEEIYLERLGATICSHTGPEVSGIGIIKNL